MDWLPEIIESLVEQSVLEGADFAQYFIFIIYFFQF
jgi:hypothetical protein